MRLTNYKGKTTYEVEGPLYVNDITKVWCGRTVADGRELFVKILNYGEVEEKDAASELLDMAKQETSTLKKVSECSKFVPGLRDSWQDTNKNRYIIVMDKVPGTSLRQWMITHAKESLSAKDIFVRKCIVLQLCEIMRDINRKYPIIVHRDLKPENVYINFNAKTKKWDVFIIDFGCANLNHIRKVGTANYQAPEQLRIGNTGIDISNKTDIFAIGQIFYELLMGNVPVIGTDYQYKNRQERWITIPKPEEYLLAISGVDKIVAVIEEMTSLHPEDRPTYDRIIANIKNIRIG